MIAAVIFTIIIVFLFKDYKDKLKKKQNMKNLFGCFGVILLLPIMVIGLILFNSWYLQVIYNIGLIPIFSQFGVFLPQLGFWVFVLIEVVIGTIKVFFTDVNKPKSETKESYNIFDSEQLAKAFSPLISNILTKLIQLGLLAIAFNICFQMTRI